MKKTFPFPMSRSEKTLGWIYFFIHMFLLSLMMSYLWSFFETLFGVQIDLKWADVIYYGTGFLYLIFFLNSFLRKSFSDLIDNLLDTASAIVQGYALYFISGVLVQVVLGFIIGTGLNPNAAAIDASTKLNPNTMLVIGVLLAPIVEETLFRGVMFGTIRKYNRILAYAVSSILFAVYHLWSYFIWDYDWRLFLYLLQYIPGGLVLAWSYERGKNIWSSIILHALINLIALKVTIG